MCGVPWRTSKDNRLPLRYLALGDSYTIGTGASDEAHNYPSIVAKRYLKATGRKDGDETRDGSILKTWKEMRLEPAHPNFSDLQIASDGEQSCKPLILVRWKPQRSFYELW